MSDKMIELKIKVFASLKDFWSEGDLVVETARGSSAKTILKCIERKLLQVHSETEQQVRLSKIISEAVLASSIQILHDEDTIENNCDLAVLPPVCGG